MSEDYGEWYHFLSKEDDEKMMKKIKMVKVKYKDCLSAEDLRRAAKKLERKIKGDKDN